MLINPGNDLRGAGCHMANSMHLWRILLPAAQSAIALGLLVVLFAENGLCRAVVESLAGAEATSLARPDTVGSALGALRFFRPVAVVLVALAGGFCAEYYGVGSILVWLAFVQCLAVLASLLIHDQNRLARQIAHGTASGSRERAGVSVVPKRPGVLHRLFRSAVPPARLREPLDTGCGAARAPYDRGLWAFILAMVLFHFCDSPAGVYLGLFLKRDLNAPDRTLSFAFVVSMIAWTLIARPSGRLADRIGRRPLLIAGWLTMAVRLVLIAVADAGWQILAIQVLDAVASGLFSVLAAAWVTGRLGDARRVTEAQVIVGTSLVFGSALGPAVAAQVVDYVGYRGLFGALAVVGGIASLGLIAYVPETLRGGRVAGVDAVPILQFAAAEIPSLMDETGHDNH